ncbi:hypothetical protein [Clostridium ganghwense]|uniref:DUF7210 domain-containing protein n=1 Tax=Clostridium ganghwense TaxID=312089 RepID=A0ABT4CTQ9_9CLOT|nr:hypothetical protein [Clostridium ganghwense]MCY6372460.1 hypothetical protein [Clostridium ganghwense]
MAKKKIKAKALVNLKYDKEIKKIGEELKIRIDNVESMVDRGLIVLLEDIPEKLGEDDETGGESNEKEGE